ncbi:MAG: division/cell wall cluster transcriptional repressor MraZ [Oscillospiraceae bacterium]|nr:division/cell wall cluster transcriptional repressor MraZ [Oscillospiraceae bacterium]
MTGVYSHTIDAKGRLFIPARLREELGDVFYVTVSGDRCLNAYPEETWEDFRTKVRQLERRKQNEFRPIFSHAVKCEIDAQGRILLPKELRERKKLEKNVVIVGNNDIAEIWDAAEWERQDMDEASDENLERLFDSGVI